MNSVEVLEQARALIADPKRWTRLQLARDENGKGLGFEENSARRPEACAWCALGAVFKVTDDWVDRRDSEHALYQAALAFSPVSHPVSINDRQGHEEVMRMYDRAIAAERKRLA